MKHEAKRKGEVVLDFGIRSLDSIPDKESDNDGSSDSSDKSAENSPERRRGAGAAVVPRKLQFSPSERDDDGDGGERRMKGKGARAVSSGEEEQVEDEDAYEPSFIDDGDEARESDSESLSDSDPSVDDGENASPANWRSTSPRATPKTKGKGAARIPLSELNNGQQQPPVLLTFLQSLSLPRPNERCVWRSFLFFYSRLKIYFYYLFSHADAIRKQLSSSNITPNIETSSPEYFLTSTTKKYSREGSKGIPRSCGNRD